MRYARPLPDFLVERHHAWRAGLSEGERGHFARVAAEAQAPQGMVVACCDSRVMVASVFGGSAGDFFVHRNIANLVPGYAADDGLHGTSATLEYAVTALNVRHLIVMGHLGCGGVASCIERHGRGGDAWTDGFVGRWLTILRPRVPPVLALGLNAEATLRALEHEAILLSLENLMTFPFVAERVQAGRIELHGVWKDIGDGVLEYYDATTGRFREV